MHYVRQKYDCESRKLKTSGSEHSGHKVRMFADQAVVKLVLKNKEKIKKKTKSLRVSFLGEF